MNPLVMLVFTVEVVMVTVYFDVYSLSQTKLCLGENFVLPNSAIFTVQHHQFNYYWQSNYKVQLK